MAAFWFLYKIEFIVGTFCPYNVSKVEGLPGTREKEAEAKNGAKSPNRLFPYLVQVIAVIRSFYLDGQGFKDIP